MKYTVTINEKSKSITVDLDGYKGVAKCCEGDQFNLGTGIELALERAKNAKKEAEASKSAVTKSGDVMELVKALEKALPKGQMVVVGNGERLTEENKAQLLRLSGHKCKCGCPLSDDEIEAIKDAAYDEGYADGQDDTDDRYDEGYKDGYDEGYSDAMDEVADDLNEAQELGVALERVRELLNDLVE